MAYEVTATRRRPKTFDEMAGQEFVVATLKSSIESGRIAHAYLFSGPRGCGKTSAARILARSLNCEQGPTVAPCGVCPACQEIARGSSLDVIEIDGASNTSVNDVRQIKDEVLFPPNSGRYKVYIIDEVHMLSNSAFNALLKTIEEPPPYIVFIFATTELHKVPATIKSRCQQFNFRLFSVETIKSMLAQACAESKIEAEDEALFWIAKEATGSMRDAYTLFDQVASFSDGKLSAELIREKLGLVGFDATDGLAAACAEGRTADALSAVDAILQRGVSVEQFVVDLAGYYRSLLMIKNGIVRESLLGYAPERFSPVVLQTLSGIQIERALSLVLDLHRDIRFSVSPRFELETAVSRLCWLTRWVSPAELRAAIDDVRGRLLSPSSGARWGPPEGGLAADSDSGSGDDRAAPAAAEAAAEAPAPISAEELAKPGGLTEGFKRFMAEREGRALPAAAPAPRAEPDRPAAPALSVPPPAPQSAPAPAPVPPAWTVPAPPASSLDDPDEEPDGDEEPLDDPGESDTAHPGQPEAPAREPEPPRPAPAIASPGPAAAAPEPSPIAPRSTSGFDLEAGKRAVIDSLKRERGMLASGLEKTGAWELVGDTLTIPASDRLSAEILRRDQAVIGAALRDLPAAGSLKIDIRERAAEQLPGQKTGAAASAVPAPVETVRRLFRGTIVRNATS